MSQLDCKSCGQPFTPPYGNQRNCDECLQKIRAYSPAVYRWVAPDGRSYVGSTVHSFIRHTVGLDRKNRRIDAALKEYPQETWAYEVLEQLDPECSEAELRLAEQQHIERLRTWMPEYGFNMTPAVLEAASPEHRAQSSQAFRAIPRVTP